LEEADKLCKRLAIIDSGKIVASGSPAELKHEIGADSIIIGLENCERDREKAKNIIKTMTGVKEIIDSEECINVYAQSASSLIADIVRALDSSDIRLTQVTFSQPSLDDVFTKHTGRKIRVENSLRLQVPRLVEGDKQNDFIIRYKLLIRKVPEKTCSQPHFAVLFAFSADNFLGSLHSIINAAF
jgi:hypothetical protein